MDNNTERRRASLRGKGREILLGQQADQSELSGTTPDETSGQSTASVPKAVDPASLALSNEETDALLGFSLDDPVFDLDLPLPDESDAEAEPVATEAAFIAPDVELSDWAFEDETLPAGTIEDEFTTAASSTVASSSAAGTASAVQGSTGSSVESSAPTTSAASTARTVRSGGALPLGERTPGTTTGSASVPYQPAGEVEALTPVDPEYWADVGDDDEGGLLLAASDTAITEEDSSEELLPEPFETSTTRADSSVLFEATATPDKDLMTMLVDDDRIRALADRIETLQEELATNFNGPRSAVDTFQKELLMANGKLMEGREYYDDAHAVVYRVWADMNRIRRTEANILRYRPLLLNYYVGWGVVLGVLFLLKALFTGVTEAVGMETASAMYYPMLLGVAGALLSGLLTLERHTTRLRDFDPIHISWYLFNPLLGGVMGLLMFLIASIANEDLLHESASDAEHAITFLLCVVAGMNQNNVLRQLNDLLKRFGRNNGDSDD